jgi:chromosome segregation ATPase
MYALTAQTVRTRNTLYLTVTFRNFERSSQTYLLDLQATKASAQNEIDVSRYEYYCLTQLPWQGLHSALEDLQEQLQASVREKHALQELFDQGAETQGELKARMCALEHSVHSHQAYAQAQKERIEWFEQERQRRNEEHEQVRAVARASHLKVSETHLVA